MKSLSVLLCIVASCLIENVTGTNLDPLKGCVDPGTRDELQAAIDLLQANIPDVNVRTLELCSDTRVKFKKGDDRIYIAIEAKEFVLTCESIGSCTIDGGSKGRHDKDSRIFHGDGGFLSLNAIVALRSTVHIEGIKFSNFGATHNGGVINVYATKTLSLYLYKCSFENNFAKFHGGAIFYEGAGAFQTQTHIKDCAFRNNEADLNGGAIAFRVVKSLMYIVIRDTHFTKNYAKENGGGLIIAGPTKEGYKTMVLRDCQFRDNKASKNGGGMWASIMSHLFMKDTMFKDNNAIEGEAQYLASCNVQAEDVDYNSDSLYEFSTNYLPSGSGPDAGRDTRE